MFCIIFCFFFSRVSRAPCEEMDDEDFILKITYVEIFYKHCRNRKISLEYLLYKINNQHQDIKNYKCINLKKEKNDIFNRYFNDHEKEMLKLGKQFAFICFRKKVEPFDIDKKVYKKSDLPTDEHTEDKICEQLLEIYHKDDCCYSEIDIFSTNSLCCLRHNHLPCMIHCVFLLILLNKKHSIKSTIGYFKPWGFSGSYESHLPEYPIKDCIYNFESQMLGSKDIINNSAQTSTNEKIVDKELLIPIYKQIISEVKNKTFLMKDTESINTKIKQVNCDLKPLYSKIPEINTKPGFKSNFINNLHNILPNLYRIENSEKTFSDFRKHGLEMFEQSMKKIYDLLIEHADIYEEIHKCLKNDFFPWWAKKVEHASSEFLKKEISCFLQESAICLFLRDITETENFLEIGKVTRELEHLE